MKFSFLFALLFSLQASATIYGNDSRQLVRRSSISNAPSRSVAIMVANTLILDSEKSPGLKKLDTAPLSENQYMCKGERFADAQSLFVSCTGFLIAPDLLLTAGHCAINYGEDRQVANPYCTDFSWYFDFEADMQGKVITDGISADSIYACEKVIHVAHISVPISDREIKFDNDFALIKLKKAVTNRTPIKLTSIRPAVGESISMTGHPLGGPKISTTGAVLSNDPAYVRAAISGFDGNSGSPVFNAKGEAFGILVRGYPPSLIESAKDKTCMIANRCSADAKSCTMPDPNGQPAGDHIMPLDLISELKELNLVK
jgi:V8-like Glu-specific endopeptidase